MVSAIVLLLALAPIESRTLPRPVIAARVQARAAASAEIVRVGRVGGEAGPEDIRAPLRTDPAGRTLAEFR